MKELYIFLSIFFFLALGMHFNEWLSHPLVHISNLQNAGAYGFGSLHPLIFTLLIYILLIPFRLLAKLVKKRIKKSH